MNEVIVNRLGGKKFRVVTDGYPNSPVILDFNGFSLENIDIVIHHRAQPKDNKALWTWGVYDCVSDNYYSTGNILFKEKNQSADIFIESQTRTDDISLLPSHILVIPHGEVSVKGDEFMVISLGTRLYA